MWLELMALGPVIRQEPLYSDAVAVARETMRRVVHNTELLIPRLRALDYRFTCEHENRPFPPLVVADAQSRVQLDAAEQTYGVLPLSVRMLYEVIDVINLCGSHPRLNRYSEFDRGIGEHPPASDPLFIAPFDPLEGTVEGVFTSDNEPMTHLGNFASLWIMPDIVMKAGESGGVGSDIIVPNPAMDVPLLHGDWPGMPWVSYLRRSFRWGGFAAFGDMPEAAAIAQKELAVLTKDLLPI